MAESSAFDQLEVVALDQRIADADYAVQDATTTAKTRGSAQRAFAKAVKTNYNFRCAVTGITTREFLIASHIVPWADDESIRLDPQNGICLSTLVDRAFDSGYLTIDDAFTIRIDLARIAGDSSLAAVLAPHHGKKLSIPRHGGPSPEFLRRRLAASCDMNQT
ncbi:hypothetical protein GCM10027194_11860 [Thalassiella azotivora]